MNKRTKEARDVLDYMLFHNVFNMPERDGWEVTFEGDKYLMWNTKTDEFFHFVVKIKAEMWDSTNERRRQEWPDDS